MTTPTDAQDLQDLSADQLRLHFGELTADEILLVRATIRFATNRLCISKTPENEKQQVLSLMGESVTDADRAAALDEMNGLVHLCNVIDGYVDDAINHRHHSISILGSTISDFVQAFRDHEITIRNTLSQPAVPQDVLRQVTDALGNASEQEWFQKYDTSVDDAIVALKPYLQSTDQAQS